MPIFKSWSLRWCFFPSWITLDLSHSRKCFRTTPSASSFAVRRWSPFPDLGSLRLRSMNEPKLRRIWYWDWTFFSWPLVAYLKVRVHLTMRDIYWHSIQSSSEYHERYHYVLWTDAQRYLDQQNINNAYVNTEMQFILKTFTFEGHYLCPFLIIVNL